MKIDNQIKIAHLFHRAGFGATPAQLREFGPKSPKKALKFLLKDAEKIDPLIVVEEEEVDMAMKKKRFGIS